MSHQEIVFVTRLSAATLIALFGALVAIKATSRKEWWACTGGLLTTGGFLILAYSVFRTAVLVY
jgi:hypothetical protein